MPAEGAGKAPRKGMNRERLLHCTEWVGGRRGVGSRERGAKDKKQREMGARSDTQNL